MNKTYSVLLCGGGGTRLWPLSRGTYPKQFLTLDESGDSLLQSSVRRALRVSLPADLFCVAGGLHEHHVVAHVKTLLPVWLDENVITEPGTRNTFPAICLSLARLLGVGASDGDVVVFMPSDAHIRDSSEFTRLVNEATKVARSTRRICLLGVEPTHTSTQYGYICRGAAHEGGFVANITEKPNEERADELIKGGALWNAGIYVSTVGALLGEIKLLEPHSASLIECGEEAVRKEWGSIPHLSIDYAIAEKSDKVSVVPVSFAWSDLGTFESIAALRESDGVPHSRSLAIDADVFVESTTDRLVVASGVQGLCVVDTPDVLLIFPRSEASSLKSIAEKVRLAGHPEFDHQRFGYRPWGRYETLTDMPGFKVKRITVNPGGKLSLQSHEKRAEHWVVVSGVAQVTRDENVFTMHANESCDIPRGARHRLENPMSTPLELIEVQTGDYLGEDDIVRYEDIYSRK